MRTSNLPIIEKKPTLSGPFRNHFFAFLICFIIAIVFTLPGSIHPESALLGYPGDNIQHAWFLWHFARATIDGQNPFYTNLIFYPSRVNLAWSTTDPLVGTLSLPLSVFFGPIAAYNLSLILQLALGAFFARLLCLRICRSEIAAFIGGIVFGFSPFLLAHALGHLSLVTVFPIPLYVLALDRIVNDENPSWKEGMLLGLALLLSAFAHYNYTVFCLMLTCVVLIVELSFKGLASLKTTWKPFCVGGATFLLGFVPFLKMLLGNPSDVPSPRTVEHIQQYSADVFGFLIPSWNHILFGHFARNLDPGVFVAGFEGTVYIGPVILILAVIGISKGREINKFWAIKAGIVAFVFLFLSWGPKLRFFGDQTGIPGPAFLLYETRVARFLSAPARFDVIVMLGLAILCSLGFARLLAQLKGNRSKLALVSVVIVLLMADLLTVPFPTGSSFDAERYPDSAIIMKSCAIPATVQNGTILTFPLQKWPFNVKAMAMQIDDDGRYSLVDGYVSYGTDSIWSQFDRYPVLRSMLALQGNSFSPVDPAADKPSVEDTIRSLNLSAIVIFDSAQQGAAMQYFEDVLGRVPSEEGTCSIFDLR